MDFAKNLPPLKIDKNKLMQVVVNMIKNSYEAIDAKDGEASEKKLVVRTFRDQDQTGFEITDSGIGIDPDKTGDAFEYGQSGKGSSGFGLYYCKIFAEANRGKLMLTSPGKGLGATIRMVFEPETLPDRDVSTSH